MSEIELADIRRKLWFGGGFENNIEKYKYNKFNEINELGYSYPRELNLEYWQKQTRDDWLEYDPQNPKQVFEFYKQCDSYIPELMLWNVEQVSEFRQYHKWLKKYNCDSILDYGAGIGDNVLYLDNYFDAYYADVNGITAEFFNKRCKVRKQPVPMVRINQFDFDLRQVDKTFDAIVCVDVLEHLPDPIRVLNSFRDSLSEGGLLFTQWTFNDMAEEEGVYTPLHIQDGQEVSSRVLDHLRKDFTQVDSTWSNVVRCWKKDS